MRLFITDKALESIRAEVRREERANIQRDIQSMSANQAEIAKLNGNLPVPNGWNGISVRYACAIVRQRQLNEDNARRVNGFDTRVKRPYTKVTKGKH